MTTNSKLSDPGQLFISWTDAGAGSVGYLGKHYISPTVPDSNPAVIIALVSSGVYSLDFGAYGIPPLTVTATLAAAKLEAEDQLNANGFLDFTVAGPATLTALNEDGTTLVFTVKSSQPWTFTSSVGWATADVPNAASGPSTVTVTIADNAGAARTGTLTFSNGTVSYAFAIGQAINA